MPKHALTFKHFLGSRQAQRPERKENSVNELLSRSRQAVPASAVVEPVAISSSSSSAPTTSALAPTSAPAAIASGSGGVPLAVASPLAASSRERPPHMWENAEDAVHPAELLRREQAAHARAARSVAGPAPPRSWRAPPKPAAEKKEVWRDVSEAFIAREMRVAARYLDLDFPATEGPKSLVGCCIGVVLQTIAGRATPGADEDGEEYDAQDMATAMLLAARELGIGLRGRILADSAARLPRDPLRLSDTAVRVLLEHDASVTHVAAERRLSAEHSEGADGPDHAKSTGHAEGDGRDTLWPQEPEPEDEEDWDDDPNPTLSHLALTAHPAPYRLLLDVPRLHALSLTTLNLAFASVPAMDKLANVLPPSLRALGLAGVRSAEGYASWSRGMGALGRKMTVLHTLDISHLPVLVSPILDALFGYADDSHAVSPGKHLPSLRRLGMRGNTSDGGSGIDAGRDGVVSQVLEDPERQQSLDRQDDGTMQREREARDVTRAMVRKVVNGGARSGGGRKWVEITF